MFTSSEFHEFFQDIFLDRSSSSMTTSNKEMTFFLSSIKWAISSETKGMDAV